MREEIPRSDLMQRIERLETRLRWTTAAGIAVAVALAALLALFRFAGYARVSAREFVLTNALGEASARLAFLPEGPGLEIDTPAGSPRVKLVGGPEDALLDLYVPKTSALGNASMNIYHGDELISSLRAGLAGASLKLASAADNSAATLALADGAATFSLAGAGEKTPRLTLDSDRDHACATLDAPVNAPSRGTLCFHSPGLPVLELRDFAGNEAVLGAESSARSRAGEPPPPVGVSLALTSRGGKVLRLMPH